MKALTVYQPWASLIIAGAKPWEFRGRAVPRWLVGRKLVIHAAARKVRPMEVNELLLAAVENGRWAETGLLREKALPILEDVEDCPTILPLSACLGTVTIGEAIPAHLIAALGDSDRTAHHVMAWPMTNPEPFPRPEPMSGLQGFWNYPRHPALVAF